MPGSEIHARSSDRSIPQLWRPPWLRGDRMTWVLVGLGCLLALAVFSVAWRGGRLRRLIDTGHLLELAQEMVRAKAEALSVDEMSRDAPAAGQLPPGGLVTSEGLFVVYTVDAALDSPYSHHLSMSLGGGSLPLPIGRILVVFLHQILGLEGTAIGVGRSEGGRFHLRWELSGSEQASFAAREVQVPTLFEIEEHLAAWMRAAREVEVTRFDTRLLQAEDAGP
jgi:hypothetical protein